MANVFKRFFFRSRKTGAIGQNDLLSSISILEISMEAHQQVACEHR
jgi:hypothetical protein